MKEHTGNLTDCRCAFLITFPSCLKMMSGRNTEKSFRDIFKFKLAVFAKDIEKV